MLTIHFQAFRLSWARFLWRLLGLPPAMKPEKGIQFSLTTGYLYGRKSRPWHKGTKPKALKSPPRGGSALPGAPDPRIPEGAASMTRAATRGPLSTAQAVTGLRSLGGPPPDRQKPPAKRGPLIVITQEHFASEKPMGVSGMADTWYRLILKDWGSFLETGRPTGQGGVCTEYRRGILRAVWDQLTEGVDVPKVHEAVQRKLRRNGLLAEFIRPHLARVRQACGPPTKAERLGTDRLDLIKKAADPATCPNKRLLPTYQLALLLIQRSRFAHSTTPAPLAAVRVWVDAEDLPEGRISSGSLRTIVKAQLYMEGLDVEFNSDADIYTTLIVV